MGELLVKDVRPLKTEDCNITRTYYGYTVSQRFTGAGQYEAQFLVSSFGESGRCTWYSIVLQMGKLEIYTVSKTYQIPEAVRAEAPGQREIYFETGNESLVVTEGEYLRPDIRGIASMQATKIIYTDSEPRISFLVGVYETISSGNNILFPRATRSVYADVLGMAKQANNATAMIRAEIFAQGHRGEYILKLNVAMAGELLWMDPMGEKCETSYVECRGEVTVTRKIAFVSGAFRRKYVFDCKGGDPRALVHVVCVPSRCLDTLQGESKTFIIIDDDTERLHYTSNGKEKMLNVRSLGYHSAIPEWEAKEQRLGIGDWFRNKFGESAEGMTRIYKFVLRLSENAERYGVVVILYMGLWTFLPYLPVPVSLMLALGIWVQYVRAEDGMLDAECGLHTVMASMAVFRARDPWHMLTFILVVTLDLPFLVRLAIAAAVIRLRGHKLTWPISTYIFGEAYPMLFYVIEDRWVSDLVMRIIGNTEMEVVKYWPKITPDLQRAMILGRDLLRGTLNYHSAMIYRGRVDYVRADVDIMRAAARAKVARRRDRMKLAPTKRRNVKGLKNYIFYPEEYRMLKPYLNIMSEAELRLIYMSPTILVRRPWDFSMIKHRPVELEDL